MASPVKVLAENNEIRRMLTRMSYDAELPVSAHFLRTNDNAREPSVLHAHLESLLRREPGIFLERYGMVLSEQELRTFEGVDDNAVQHYVRQYTCVTKSASKLGVSKAVKNRRFAMMKKLDAGGNFFSMESMRQRDPILYHEYVGRLPWPGIDDSAEGPGDCKLSERIMRQHEGLEQARCLQAATLRTEQNSNQAAQEAMPLQTVFEGSAGGAAMEEDIDSPRGTAVVQAAAPARAAPKPQAGSDQPGSESKAAVRLQVSAFEAFMRQRFLAGGDAEFVDYVAIDNDTTLDEFWAREEALDAQEKYFDDIS